MGAFSNHIERSNAGTLTARPAPDNSFNRSANSGAACASGGIFFAPPRARHSDQTAHDRAILDEMQSYRPNLGELRSVHRPLKPRLWRILALSTPLLMIGTLCILLILDSFTGLFTGSTKGPSGSVSNPLICMGVVGLLLALLGNILVSDYRAWSATRTVKLTIYQEGFTYESQGRMEVCRWDEIEIKTRLMEVVSKAFRGRVKVIRAIVKKDGTEIVLAQTLNLRQITELITAAKEKAG